jgi:acyl-CoA thioesterase FadM
MNQNLTWETVIPVRSYELDFAGIVNNAVYTQSATATTGGSSRWPKR